MSSLASGFSYTRAQITLFGEVIVEKYLFLRFVSAEIVALKKNIWFVKLDLEQTIAVQDYLQKQQLGYNSQGSYGASF